MKTKYVVEKTVITLGAKEVEEAIKKHLNLPDNCKVEFTIPGGGDWSGDTIEAETFREITAMWTSEYVEEIEDDAV